MFVYNSLFMAMLLCIFLESCEVGWLTTTQMICRRTFFQYILLRTEVWRANVIKQSINIRVALIRWLPYKYSKIAMQRYLNNALLWLRVVHPQLINAIHLAMHTVSTFRGSTVTKTVWTEGELESVISSPRNVLAKGWGGPRGQRVSCRQWILDVLMRLCYIVYM